MLNSMDKLHELYLITAQQLNKQSCTLLIFRPRLLLMLMRLLVSDKFDSILTCISSRNIRRLERVLNSLLVQVPNNNQHHFMQLSIRFIGFQFSNELISILYSCPQVVHRSLHNAGPQNLSSYDTPTLHRFSFALLYSLDLLSQLFSFKLAPTMLLPLVVLNMLALLFGIPI